MTPAEKLKETLKHMSKRNVTVQTFWATVVSVDWNEKTADVKDLAADLEVYDVLLGLGGDLVKPKLNSKCLCGIAENQEGAAFILYCEEVEERWINGGGNGGLTITPLLVEQLDKLTARVDGIINAINNGIPAGGSSDGGTALLASIVGGLTAIVDKEDFTNIENTKVKHG